MKPIKKTILLVVIMVCMAGYAFGQASSTNYNLQVGVPVGGGGSSNSTNYGMIGAVPLATGLVSSSTNFTVNGGTPAATAAFATLEASYSGAQVQTVSIANRTVEVNYSSIQAVTGAFFYRQGGYPVYEEAAMTETSSGVLSYTIPSNLFTVRGLEYFFVIEDGISAVAIGNPGEPYKFVVNMTTNAQGRSPSPTPDRQYRIIGFPINPTASSVSSVFYDDFGQPDDTQYRLGRYYASGDSVRSYANAGAVSPGRGYWAITRGAKYYGTPGTSVLPNAEDDGHFYYQFTLDSGWNMIANPFGFDFNLNAVKINDGGLIYTYSGAVTNDLIDGEFWMYNGTAYVNRTSIPAWNGGFIKANQPGLSIMILYEQLLVVKTVAEEPFNGWRVNLTLETPNGLMDSYNFAGASVEADNARDIYDASEPPPPPGGPMMAFVTDDPYSRLKSADIRGTVNDGAIWTVELKDCPDKSKLTVNDLDQVPPGMEVWVRKSGDLIKIEEDNPLILSSDDTGFDLIIGTPEFIAGKNDGLLPLTFSLSQNYPNPFNPVTGIKFSLPNAGQAKLEVFNILGQTVKTLVDDHLSAGQYTVEWDSRNNEGYEVASGIYFYKLTFENYSDHKKMVLLK